MWVICEYYVKNYAKIICLMGIIMWLMGTINNLNSNDVKK